jgi:chloride channel 3/4/5
MIWSNGFPLLDNKDDHVFNVPVSHAMTTDPVTLPASGFPVREAEHLLSDNKFQGFPIVEDRTKKMLVGYIGRTELRYAIDRVRAEGMLSPSALCVFTKEAAEASVARRASSSSRHLAPDSFDAIQQSVGSSYVDFSRYADHTPLTVHPRLPLETVIEIFKKIGPRVILVEHRGRLTGLVTVKDCLKYQFKVEAQEHALAATQATEGPLGSQSRPSDTLEDRVWNLMQRVGSQMPRWRQASRPAPLPAPREEGISTGPDDENDRLMELEER